MRKEPMNVRRAIPTTDVALLLIDVQNGFLDPSGMAARLSGGVLPECSAATVEPLKRAIAAARAAGVPIIYTQHALEARLQRCGPDRRALRGDVAG